MGPPPAGAGDPAPTPPRLTAHPYTTLPPPAPRARYDQALFAADVSVPLFEMLQSESEETRMAALKALPGLVNRSGPILRLQVATRANVDILWSLILATKERKSSAAGKEDGDAALTKEASAKSLSASAKEGEGEGEGEGEEEEEDPWVTVQPPTPQLYYALRVMNAMVFADFESSYFVIGAPEAGPDTTSPLCLPFGVPLGVPFAAQLPAVRAGHGVSFPAQLPAPPSQL